jgi:hypothetical protein
MESDRRRERERRDRGVQRKETKGVTEEMAEGRDSKRNGGKERGGEIRSERHGVYIRINRGKETVGMRYRRRDRGEK